MMGPEWGQSSGSRLATSHPGSLADVTSCQIFGIRMKFSLNPKLNRGRVLVAGSERTEFGISRKFGPATLAQKTQDRLSSEYSHWQGPLKKKSAVIHCTASSLSIFRGCPHCLVAGYVVFGCM